MRMSRLGLRELLRPWGWMGRLDCDDHTRRRASGSARPRYGLERTRRVSLLSDHEWWRLAGDDRAHVGQRGILRAPVAAVRVDAGKPERPRWSWVGLEMDSTEALFVWFGSKGPLGGATGCTDDVVFSAHGIDVSAGIEAEVTGVVDQHAR